MWPTERKWTEDPLVSVSMSFLNVWQDLQRRDLVFHNWKATVHKYDTYQDQSPILSPPLSPKRKRKHRLVCPLGMVLGKNERFPAETTPCVMSWWEMHEGKHMAILAHVCGGN